ncbi:MAG: hypothetical protein ACREC1_10650 [Methylovirgula sp.]
MERTIRFDWRHIVWIAALIAVSVGLSLAFACAVPLAAFAALAALTMRRSEAVVLILVIVLANQCVGFAVLHFPAAGLVWSAAFALVGVAGVFAAEWTYHSAALAHPIVACTSAFLAAFAAYEGGLFLITLAAAPGDLATYAAPVVLRILAINTAAFLGLLVAARIAVAVLGVPGGLGMRQRPV